MVPDNYLFARCAQFIKNRKELSEESVPLLEEIVQDAGIAQSILDAARSSMGKLFSVPFIQVWWWYLIFDFTA